MQALVALRLGARGRGACPIRRRRKLTAAPLGAPSRPSTSTLSAQCHSPRANPPRSCGGKTTRCCRPVARLPQVLDLLFYDASPGNPVFITSFVLQAGCKGNTGAAQPAQPAQGGVFGQQPATPSIFGQTSQASAPFGQSAPAFGSGATPTGFGMSSPSIFGGSSSPSFSGESKL